MNRIFVAMVVIAFAVATGNQLGVDLLGWELAEGAEQPMEALGNGAMKAAKASVDLAIGLVGYMALFLGLMKVGEHGGLLTIIAKLLRPLLVLLFPGVPPNHPAMGAMILNMSANALGLGNAATPFGIRAMQELNKLNRHKGTATNAMALFLAINTSAVTLLPSGVIGIRASLNSGDAAGIMGPTLFATTCSTLAGVTAAIVLARFVPLPELPEAGEADAADEVEAGPELEDHGAYPLWVSVLALLCLPLFAIVALVFGSIISKWIIPVIIVALTGFGWARGVAVYEVFVEGAKEGFEVAVRIIPYLVAILAAVGMLRGSGALDLFVGAVGPVTSMVGMPAEALPMALIRPLSGSGAFGVLMETMNTHGPDSYIGYLVSTLQGSTETTFYTIAVYFGAVRVSRLRHTMVAALCADAMGIMGAVVGVNLYFWFMGL